MARQTRTKKPRHHWETRAYPILLHPTPAQQKQFWHIVHGCWLLRAKLVNDREQNRKDNREKKRQGQPVHYLTRADQYQAIPSYIAQFPDELKGIHSQVLQNVTERVDQGTKRWFEARNKGKFSVHPPHHIRRRKYRSFVYPQYGTAVNLHHGHVYLSGIGLVKADCWRKLRGKPKSVTVKYKHGQWWAIVTCAIQARDLYRPMEAVETLPDGAGDPGLESLLIDTEGVKHDPRKARLEARQRLAHEMRDMSRKFRMREDKWKEDWIEWIAQGGKPKVSLREGPYSKRLQEQIRRVAKLHARVFNIRDNDHKKLAARIERTFRLFGIEEHGLLFMLRNRRQAKLAQDRAIGRMKKIVQSKLGPRYYEVPNRGPDGRGNSQVCVCGADVPKELGGRAGRNGAWRGQSRCRRKPRRRVTVQFGCGFRVPNETPTSSRTRGTEDCGWGTYRKRQKRRYQPRRANPPEPFPSCAETRPMRPARPPGEIWHRSGSASSLEDCEDVTETGVSR